MKHIKYDIDPETGKMRLRFDKSIISSLSKDKQKVFNDYILAMMAMNGKLILTGSLSLKLLGFEDMGNDVGDFDFGLLDTFTEEDYHALKNFFQLSNTKDGYTFDSAGDKVKEEYKFNPKDHMWQFTKKIVEPYDSEPEDELDKLLIQLDGGKVINFKMDIFNDEIIRERDIINVYWDDFELKLVHPSITYSYRMRYALDVRTSTTFKYWERMKNFMDNAKGYYVKLRAIQKMIMRVHEHNTSIENDHNKLARLRQLVANRENNIDAFFRKIFDENEKIEIL